MRTLGNALLDAADTPRQLSTVHAWWNGAHWMASASFDTYYLQVAGPCADPETAMVEAIELCIAKLPAADAKPSVKNSWEEDGY